MSALQSFMNSPVLHQIAITLLHSLWQGAAIFAGLAVAMSAMAKTSPQKRYAVAAGAMFLLVAAPLATFLWIGRASAAPLPADQPPQLGLATDTQIGTLQPAPADTISREPQLVVATRTVGAGWPAPRSLGERTAAALPWIALSWIAGVVVLAMRNLGGWFAMQQMRFTGTAAGGPDAERLARSLSRRLGVSRAVRVLKSSIARTPLVIGLIKPVILLPVSALTELSIAELESILAHELAHIRRYDFAVNLLQTAVETILFYHPAVWLVSSRIRQERENCCDDLALSVTRDRASYVRALAAVASVRVTSLVPAASSGKLLPRLQRLLGVSDRHVGRPSGWSAAAVLLTLGLCAVLFSGSHAQVTDKKAEAAAGADDVVWVRGHVLDPQGKRVAGAQISTTAWPFTSPLSQAKSGPDGAYAISFRKSQFGETWNSWESTVVAATMPGFGPGWSRCNRTNDKGEVVLTLATDDVPLQGRILDLEGRPVRGVNVVVTAIRAQAVDLSKLNIDRSDPSRDAGDNPPNLDGAALGSGQSATTSADGRFGFSGLGRDRTIEMIATGGGIAQSYIEASTRLAPTQSREFQAYIRVTETTYGSTFDFVAQPGRTVRGTVRDAATGQSLAGVSIKTGLVRMGTVTDSQGHYQMEGFRPSESIQLTAVPQEGAPYLMRDMSTPRGNGPATIDFDLHRGVLISGRIVDKNTGSPVHGMEVIYYPCLTNAAAQKLTEFLKDDVPTRFGRCYSHADGSFHIVGLPGKAVLATRGGNTPFRKGTGKESLKVPLSKNGTMQVFGGTFWTPHSFLCVKDIDIPEGQSQASLSFESDPGITVHLQLVDGDGNPVSGATILGHKPDRGYEHLKGDGADVIAIAPDETRRITLFQKDRQLGRVLMLKAADFPSGTAQVKLEPVSYVTGRLLGADGQPMADAMVQGPLFQQYPAGTDANGHFKMLVLPGLPYNLFGIKGRTDFATDAKGLTLAPGETRDLGDVHANH
ncbi:MAG TPA: M56 family metallopeptidase [Tepidisphaeraceae bacterium]|nr:M56 family metallopeptidase [Tepidisphaeraceae bacterium]